MTSRAVGQFVARWNYLVTNRESLSDNQVSVIGHRSALHSLIYSTNSADFFAIERTFSVHTVR